ncbi:uncharacterized protein BCR38DRAFT_75693 [Pseudomassariella vexata]|uniref:Uncharacterized protein n=1 Tax=Pseudomassariella vexata TaxID=1141098 RepID=A0A1Y2DFM4_9PEZI|nr:uncharacterized protein BCR38DRAFT_75693 [Pseudomassariella vexata]ORY58058.1 hypothetical protein BCR38DRAFT_75693 [Pseudomassariella vexata]
MLSVLFQFLLLTSLPPSLTKVLHPRQNPNPGPCKIDDCYDVIESSACWNSVINNWPGRNDTDPKEIFQCTPGGQTTMCQCYGCDSILDQFVVNNRLCNGTIATRYR